MVRWLTAGESHGPELVAVIEGLPAGIPIAEEDITEALARRRLGYGRGARMKFEADQLSVSGGIRHGLSQGGPIALRPWVFEMPANDKRYELMPFMDACTNVFASPGTRTSGNQGATYLLAGPEWDGQVPKGMTLLKSPTDMVWLIGRTQTNGAADFATVHELQNRLRLTKWPMPENPTSANTDSKRDAKPDWQVSLEPSLAPVAQMKALSTPEFFNRLMQLMVSHPASKEDAPLIERLAHLEIKPGQAVHLSWSSAWSFSWGR